VKRTLTIGVLFVSILCVTAMHNTAAKASEKAPYKIGAVLPLSGYLAWLGEYYKKGADLQVEIVNKSGGVDGHPLELIAYDDQSSPEQGSRVAHRLISKDGVVALIGTASVPISGAVASVANKNKVPLLISSGYEVDPNKDTYVFNTVHKTDFAVIVPFQYFQKNGIKKLALLMPLGPLGELGSKIAHKYAPNFGITIVGEEKFDTKSPDVTAQLAKIRGMDPQAIFSFVTGEPAALIARNMDQINLKVPLLVSHGNATPGFLKLVSGLTTTILVPSGKVMKPEAMSDSDRTKRVVEDFNKKHVERYGEPANYFSAMQADAVTLIAEGLRKVGKADPVLLRDAIEKIVNFPGLQGVYNLSPSDHHGTQMEDMILLTVKDGKWELMK
jgi:branched-chain amino acid transport system substrate-binding protein